MNDTACRTIMTLHAVEIKTNGSLRTKIAKLLPPEMMFNNGTDPYPILWAELRQFLTDHHVQLLFHQRHRAMHPIANTIYIDGDDNLTDIELAKLIINGSIYFEDTNVSNTTNAHESASDTHGSRKSDREKRQHGMLLFS